MPSRWMTVEECADEARVSKMTIYRLCHAGEFVVLRVGRQMRISRASWEAYLAR